MAGSACLYHLCRFQRGKALTSEQIRLCVDRCLDAAFAMDLDAGIAFEAGEEQSLFEDGEAAEGIAAFTGRRTPAFPSAAARD